MLPRITPVLLALAIALFSNSVTAQITTAQLAPLLAGLAHQNDFEYEKRVPLSTNDPTVAPLVDLQVYAPPAVPKHGSSCTVQLLEHSFGEGSYGAPAVVAYTPPTASACGQVGKWATVSMNISVYSLVLPLQPALTLLTITQ